VKRRKNKPNKCFSRILTHSFCLFFPLTWCNVESTKNKTQPDNDDEVSFELKKYESCSFFSLEKRRSCLSSAQFQLSVRYHFQILQFHNFHMTRFQLFNFARFQIILMLASDAFGQKNEKKTINSIKSRRQNSLCI
jgi:hypothetical protein